LRYFRRRVCPDDSTGLIRRQRIWLAKIHPWTKKPPRRGVGTDGWSAVGQRLVNGWSTVGQRLVNGWSTVGQHAKWSNLSVAALILGARSPRTRPRARARARARAILKKTRRPFFHERKSRTKFRKFVAQMCPMDKSGWGYFSFFWRLGHTHGTPGGVGDGVGRCYLVLNSVWTLFELSLNSLCAP